MKRLSNAAIKQKIKQYGRDILTSDLYAEAYMQEHHKNSSVAKHSIRVARATVMICDTFTRMGIEVDERKAVRAALMHDLGILGRDDKFDGSYETSRKHPILSVGEARRFEPEMDEAMVQAIERHMFPVFAKPPTKPEAVAVCIADKVGSFWDVVNGVHNQLLKRRLTR